MQVLHVAVVPVAWEVVCQAQAVGAETAAVAG